MKFDIIIGNPPYKNGLHIDFFNHSFDLLKDGGDLICLHPATQFLNGKHNANDKQTKKLVRHTSEYQTRLTLIDGNKLFDAGFFTPLSITHLKKVKDKSIEVDYSKFDSDKKELKSYDSFDEIFIHGNDIVVDIYNKIRNEIVKKSLNSISEHLYRRGSTDKYYVIFNRIAGRPPKNGKVSPDFHCLIYRENEFSLNDSITKTPIGKKDNGGAVNELAIGSMKEAKNAFEYLKTKFVRFCVSLRKTGPDLNYIDMELVPYMDFSQEWTDEKLYKHFGLTQEEVDFIESYIGDWYDADFKNPSVTKADKSVIWSENNTNETE